MARKPLNSFANSMAGKLVRFKRNYSTPNLSNQSGFNKIHPPQINILSGALGVIYLVRGATLFIGFGRELKSAPSKSGSPTHYAATILSYLDDIHKLEIEY